MPDNYPGTETDANAGYPGTPAAAPQGSSGAPAGQYPGQEDVGANFNKAHPIVSKVLDVAEGLKDAYKHSAVTGIFSQPTRYAMEHLDNPVTGGVLPALGVGGNIDAQLKQKFPGKTQQWYDQQKHTIYGGALTDARTQTAQDAASHPHGGIVGDIAADVVAHPENLLLPGGGAGKTVLSRIGSAATTQALGTSVEDDAAQIMDLAEGQQKKWDVNRSLESAAAGAGFGALGHAAVEAAPFVRDLFMKRGLDTTPQARPDGARVPLTGDQVSMTPGQTQALHGLLQHGSVDDIKGFLADKQGPKPTYTQVNDLVKTRDAIPDTLPNAQQAFDQHISDTRSQAVQDHIGQTTADWKNSPDIEYHQSVVHMPEGPMKQDVQAQINQTGQHPPGFFGDDNKVHIFTDQVHSPEQANALLFHEGLGHFGLQQKFGTGLDKTIDSLSSRNVGQFGKDVDQWQADHPGAYGGDRTRAGEEVLAEMSEKGPLKKSIADAMAAHVRRFGRSMGLKLSYSDAEVRHVLSMSHDAVINGNGRNVAANGYKSPLSFSANDPGNKFMFTGPKALDHDPMSDTAFMTRNKDIRNEISDHEAYLRPLKDGEQKLGNVLHHPELFEQYPQLADVPVHQRDLPGLHGGYDPETQSIHVNRNLDDTDPRKLSTVLHETQHAIQHIEGNIKTDETGEGMSEDEYRTDPREVEAHVTEDRKNLTPEERLQSYRPKFMDANRLAALRPDDVHEAAFEKFGEGYTPRFRSQADAMKAAADTPLAPDKVKDSRGVGNLDRKLFVYDNAIHDSNTKLIALSEKHTAQGFLTDDDKVELVNTINEFHYNLGRLDNDLGQVGRALNAAKQLRYRRGNIQAMQKMLSEDGSPLGDVLDNDGAEKFMASFKAIGGPGNPNGAAALMKQMSKPNWEDYIVTMHNSAMLSGLSTHVKAPQDMMIGIGRDLLNNVGALPFSAARSVLIGMGVKLKPGVHPIEVAARFNGLFRAMLDSDTYRNTMTTLAKGNVNPSGFSGKQNARIPVVSKVMDLISAQDTFFRAFATNMHLYGEGAAKAVDDFRATNGRDPKLSEFDQVNIAGQANARNPTQGMLDKAKKMADENLLLNKNKLTEGLDRMKQTTSSSGWQRRTGAFIMNILTPFVRVESNSMYTRVIRNSPLTLLDPKTWGEIKSGGRVADVAFARIMFGAAAFGAAWHAAGTGKLTGEGPENADKKAALESTGWRPDAVHENGQYSTGNSLGQSLNPLDVHNETAMTIASLREGVKKGMDKGEAALAVKFAFMSVLAKLGDMSYVSDLKPASDAVTAKGPTAAGKIGQFLGDEASTFMPNATAQIGRVINQNQKQTNDTQSWGNTIKNSVQNSIPGVRDSLPDRVDPLGQPMTSGASMAGMHSWMPQGNRLTGGNHVDEKTDPVSTEVGRLSQLYKENLITPVQKTISGVDTSNFDPKQITDSGKVQLTPEQFEHFQKVAGVQIKDTLQAEMATPAWGQMADSDKAEWLRDMQKEQKKAVKEYLYGTK